MAFVLREERGAYSSAALHAAVDRLKALAWRLGRGDIFNHVSNGDQMTYLQGNCSHRRADTVHGGGATREHLIKSICRSLVDPTSIETLLSTTLLLGGTRLKAGAEVMLMLDGMGLHSSTFRLNVSTFTGTHWACCAHCLLGATWHRGALPSTDGHIPVQRTLPGFSVSVTKTSQVELRCGRIEAPITRVVA